MRIVYSGTRVTGDSSPDTPTRVYTVQTMKCMNHNCTHPDEREVAHELYSSVPPDKGDDI